MFFILLIFLCTVSTDNFAAEEGAHLTLRQSFNEDVDNDDNHLAVQHDWPNLDLDNDDDVRVLSHYFSFCFPKQASIKKYCLLGLGQALVAGGLAAGFIGFQYKYCNGDIASLPQACSLNSGTSALAILTGSFAASGGYNLIKGARDLIKKYKKIVHTPDNTENV